MNYININLRLRPVRFAFLVRSEDRDRIVEYLCLKIQHLGFIEESFMSSASLIYEETAFK